MNVATKSQQTLHSSERKFCFSVWNRLATAYSHPATQNVCGHAVLFVDGAQAEIHELDGGGTTFFAGLQQNVLEFQVTVLIEKATGEREADSSFRKVST